MEVKTNAELADLYSAPKLQAKKRRHVSGDESTTPPPIDPTKDQGSFSNEDVSGQNSAMKQVISPSKSANLAQSPKAPVMTADDAFALREQGPAGEATPEDKENTNKGLMPRRNKFAVSALAKRAKFNLDAPALPNVTVEVKSR